MTTDTKQMWIILRAKDTTAWMWKNLQKTGTESLKTLNQAFKVLEGSILAAETAILGLGVYATKKMVTETAKLAQASLDTAASFEVYRLQFQVLVGNVEQGTKMFESLWDVARKVPQTISEVVAGAKKMEAWGAIGGDVERSMLAVADAAALTGNDMETMANVLGRAAQMGILFSRGPGAILRGIMQTKMGIRDISKLTLPEFRKALSLLLTDPKYGVAGMATKVAGTFNGLKSMIADAITNIKLELAKAGLFDEAKAFLEVIRQFLKSETIIKYFRQIGEIGGDMVRRLREKFVELVETGKIKEWFEDWVRNIRKVRDMFLKFIENLPQLGTWLSNMISGVMIGFDKVLTMLNDIVKAVGKLAAVKIRMDLKELDADIYNAGQRFEQLEKLRTKINEGGMAERIESYRGEIKTMLANGLELTQKQKEKLNNISKLYNEKDMASKITAYQAEKKLIEELLPILSEKQKDLLHERVLAKGNLKIYEEGFYVQGSITEQMEELGKTLGEVFVDAGGNIKGMKNEIVELGKATEALFPSMVDPIKTVTEKWEDFLNAIKESGKEMRDVTQQFAEGMMSNFKDLFFDAMKGELKSLGDYFRSFVNMISEIIAQQLAMKTAMGIMGMFAGAPELAMTAPMTAAPSSRVGGFISPYQTAGFAPARSAAEFATGGIVKAKYGYPRGNDTIPILASEGEMILNRRQQANLVSMLNAGGAGAGGMNVNINVSSLDGADTFRVLSRNSDAIGAILQKGMMNRKRGF